MAGASSRSEVIDIMNVYLAGEGYKKNFLQELYESKNAILQEINILESYYYVRDNANFMRLAKYFKSFLLDSGAFTFLKGTHKQKINWDNYVTDYAQFINQWDIKLFFELDIDGLVGLHEVERLRRKLEDLTHKKPIPVWHKNRGKEYFIKMCENYPYVALGGIVTKEITKKQYEQLFPWFIQTAHKNKCKIHGLGYTTVANLKKFRFDSVDSTAWLYGNLGGYVYRFNPVCGKMEQISKTGYRIKSRECAKHNFKEWVKFGVYADKKM